MGSGIGIALFLLLATGVRLGIWLAAGYYRPLLDTANSDLSTAKVGRDNLKALAGGAGQKVGRAGAGREEQGGGCR